MSKEMIIDALNKDLALEIAATLQYLHHHWTGEGFDSPAILEIFEKIGRDEIKKGGDLVKMMKDDLDGENKAIAQYKAHINHFDELGDPTSRLMMEEILSDEERHAD